MAFEVDVGEGAIVVELNGWDRAMNWCRHVAIDLSQIRSVSVVERAELERLIDHRANGCGTHNGSKRPGRRRVGTMLGRSVAGKQFWAVTAGPKSDRLLVLDLADHEFARAVVAVDDADAVAKATSRDATSWKPVRTTRS